MHIFDAKTRQTASCSLSSLLPVYLLHTFCFVYTFPFLLMERLFVAGMMKGAGLNNFQQRQLNATMSGAACHTQQRPTRTFLLQRPDVFFFLFSSTLSLPPLSSAGSVLHTCTLSIVFARVYVCCVRECCHLISSSFYFPSPLINRL